MLLKDQLANARRLLAKTEIISLPKEVMELQKYLNQEEFPQTEVLVKIIGQNAILAGEIVQAANLPSMQGSRPRKIETIRDAVNVLGSRRLKNLVTALSMKLAMETLGLKHLTQHSVQVAEACMKIAPYLKHTSVDKAYLMGLFHNVGALMLGKLDNTYEALFKKSLSSPISITTWEIEKYQTTHGVMGLLVAEEWGLEADFKKVIVSHHADSLKPIRDPVLQQDVALVQLANALVSEIHYQVYATPEYKLQWDNALGVIPLDESQLKEIRFAMLSA